MIDAIVPPRRRFIQPGLHENWQSIAARVLPDLPQSEAIEKLRSWNLHLVMRRVALVTPSDIIFIEPPKTPETRL